MPSDTDEPDSAAGRLEAALDRIAAEAAARPVAMVSEAPIVASSPIEASNPVADPEVVARLDRLIERLRGAVATPPI
jgi:hypothetical protein